MKLAIPDNLKGILLIDQIEILFNEFVKIDKEDTVNGDDVIEDKVLNCTFNSVNDYLSNFLEFMMLDINNLSKLTRDDVSYGTTLIQTLKGSCVVIDFMSMMTNIDISSWETVYDGQGRKLVVHIKRIESQQVNYVIDQFAKSLHSLIYFGDRLELDIDEIVSLIYAKEESIFSKPNVSLSGRYEFKIGQTMGA